MVRKTKKIALLCGLLLGYTSLFGANYPSVTLTKGDMEVMLLLPDSNNSYYRASRFDWGSMVGQITYKNHTYLQRWEDYCGRGPSGEHDPLTPNTGTGLSEEFITPLGYEQAEVNGHFVKIGVGVLKRADKADYNFATAYDIVDKGTREVKKTKNTIALTHSLNSDIGYGYKLERIYTIKDNKLIVRHTLINTGKKRVTTETYSHNFMQFDFGSFGTDYSLQFLDSDIDVSKQKWTTPNRVKVGEKCVNLAVDFKDYTPCFGMIDVLSGRGDCRLINKKTGMSVDINLDKNISSFVLWMWQKAICAEPRILIDIQPGETFQWSYTYTFNV